MHIVFLSQWFVFLPQYARTRIETQLNNIRAAYYHSITERTERSMYTLKRYTVFLRITLVHSEFQDKDCMKYR